MKIQALFLVLGLALLSAGACKSKKQADKPVEVEAYEEVVKKAEPARWVVTFVSEGSGPDGKAMRLLETKMGEWQKTYEWELSPERIAWGKEGEMDYCFKMSDFRNYAPQRLDALFKETFGDNPLVQWGVRDSCPHQARPLEIHKPGE